LFECAGRSVSFEAELPKLVWAESAVGEITPSSLACHVRIIATKLDNIYILSYFILIICLYVKFFLFIWHIS